MRRHALSCHLRAAKCKWLAPLVTRRCTISYHFIYTINIISKGYAQSTSNTDTLIFFLFQIFSIPIDLVFIVRHVNHDINISSFINNNDVHLTNEFPTRFNMPYNWSFENSTEPSRRRLQSRANNDNNLRLAKTFFSKYFNNHHKADGNCFGRKERIAGTKTDKRQRREDETSVSSVRYNNDSQLCYGRK